MIREAKLLYGENGFRSTVRYEMFSFDKYHLLIKLRKRIKNIGNELIGRAVRGDGADQKYITKELTDMVYSYGYPSFKVICNEENNAPLQNHINVVITMDKVDGNNIRYMKAKIPK